MAGKATSVSTNVDAASRCAALFITFSSPMPVCRTPPPLCVKVSTALRRSLRFVGPGTGWGTERVKRNERVGRQGRCRAWGRAGDDRPIGQPPRRGAANSPKIAQPSPPAEHSYIGNDNDFSGTDIDRVARYQAKRYDFPAVDHPVAELADVARILFPSPTNAIPEV